VAAILTVDVVMCSHNRERAVVETLQKLLAVRVPPDVDLRTTVVLNACTDGSRERVEELLGRASESRHQVIEEPRAGLKEARLKGVEATAGDWVVFLDDDCHVDRDWAETLTRAIESFPDGSGLGGEVVVPALHDAKRPWLRDFGWLFAEQRAPQEDSHPVEFLVGACVAYRRTVLERSGWLRQAWLEDRVGRRASSGADVELALRAKRYGPLRVVRGLRVEHRIDPGRLATAELCRLAYGLGHGSSLISVIERGSRLGALRHQVGQAIRLFYRAARSAGGSLVRGRFSIARQVVEASFISGVLTGCLAVLGAPGRRLSDVIAR
jgi:GT2 family glycosyltransferase